MKASLTPTTCSGGRWLNVNTYYTVIALHWIFPLSELDISTSDVDSSHHNRYFSVEKSLKDTNSDLCY